MQGHLEELRKMKIPREDDAKVLEKFADALERVVVNLKENDRQSELQERNFVHYHTRENTREITGPILQMDKSKSGTRVA